jgi:stress-induced morphogen
VFHDFHQATANSKTVGYTIKANLIAMTTVAQVEAALAPLEPVHLAVTDISGGCGASFEILVVSKAFDGIALMERHRLVNGALASLMSEIHAVTIKALTIAAWEAKKAKGDS